MNRSPIERDHVQEWRLVATFGAAQLVNDYAGRLAIRGGTESDRAQAKAWAERFFGSIQPVRWRRES